MAVGQQPDDQTLDQIILTDDDLADLAKKGADKRAGPLHFLIYGTDTCIHRLKNYVCPKRQSNAKNSFRKTKFPF